MIWDWRCETLEHWFSKVAQSKVKSIQAKLLAVQIWWKEYTNLKVKDTTFQAGEQVLLKLSPMKKIMRFDKKDKFNPLYIDPFEIINCVGPVAHRLGLSPSLLGLHIMFHVSMLKKYHGNGDYIIKYGSLLLDKNLQYEE